MQNKAMGTFVFTGLMAFVCPLVQAATYYASPDEGPESTKDCLTPETAGYLLTAYDKMGNGSSWSSPNTLVLKKGDYDFSHYDHDPSTAGSLLTAKKFTIIKGETGNPADVRIIGGGPELNLRFLRATWYFRLDSICVTNFGVVAENGGAVYMSIGSSYITNCEFRCCSAANGGALHDSWVGLMPVYDCKFIGNRMTGASGAQGGAANYFNCYDCHFEDNGHADSANSSSKGGALYDGRAYRCTFVNNRAYGNAALGTSRSSRAGCSDCVFSNNVGTAYGIANVHSVISNCLFTGNVILEGPLVYQDTSSENCVFASNVCRFAIYAGTHRNALIAFNDCRSQNSASMGVIENSTAINCTIVSNVASKYIVGGTGGGQQFVQNIKLYNCLFVGNVAGLAQTYGKYVALFDCVSDVAVDSETFQYDCTISPNAGKCLKWGTEPKFGLPDMPVGITRSPLLCNAGTNLTAEAATIWTADDVDYAGNGRLNGPVDIGCYERWPKIGLQILVR